MRRVVCVLDGGGMRGFYQLEVLRIIEAATQTGKLAVDLIVGVSAGAIVGAMLALDQLHDEKVGNKPFTELTREIFHNKPTNALLTRPKYDGVAKHKALVDYFGDRKMKDVRTPFCVVCSTMDGGVINYCSWKPEFEDLLLADVLNATSAAPLYFPPVKLNGIWLTDGGIRANKPLIQAVLFAWQLFGRQTDFSILSVGTYFSSKYRFDGAKRAAHMGLVGWLKQGIVNVLMGTHDTTTEQLCEQLLGNYFVRLVCMCDDITLDDHGPNVQMLLSQAAQNTFVNNRSRIARLFDIAC